AASAGLPDPEPAWRLPSTRRPALLVAPRGDARGLMRERDSEFRLSSFLSRAGLSDGLNQAIQSTAVQTHASADSCAYFRRRRRASARASTHEACQITGMIGVRGACL